MEFAALTEFNPGGADGGEQSGGKLARVEGALGELAGSSILEILQCGVGVEGDGDAGELLDAREEGRVELSAELREREQRGRIVGIVDGEYAGSSGRGVGEGGIALQNQHAGTAVVELQGDREADDTGANDEHVWR